jgi:ribonuclease P/MRP protein subunit RPP1
MIDLIQFSGELFPLGFKKVLQTKQFHIIEGGSDEINRRAVENKQVDILLSPERGRSKKYLHQRDGGLNQVLCKLAKKNKVAIGFNFSSLLNAKDLYWTLGKMLQNIRLCRKYKVTIVVASFAKNKWEMRAASDLLAFATILGMTPKEAKVSLNFQKKTKDLKVLL